MKKPGIAELNRLYSEAEEVDREVFAEQRSNILLVAGEHYSKRSQGFDRRVRGAQDLSETQKLRLTKNHVHRIQRHYVTSILAHAPGVTVLPQNEKEIQDKKDAELNKSVWEEAKAKHRLKEKIREWVNDLVTIGEVCAKVFWDPNRGRLVGYEQKVGPDGAPLTEETGEMEPEVDPGTGQPLLDPVTGQPAMKPALKPVADESRPVFSGEFVFERIFAFNLLRDPSASSMRDPKPWIVRKMVPHSHLKAAYKDDPEKLKALGGAEGRGEEFIVFDANKASYERQKGQVMVREYYYPVSTDYPEGYFFIATDQGILEEGVLPFGIFPLVWNGCDEYQSSPRRRSIIKVARPYQAEINRASSQMAMAQVTIGDDKVLYQSGTKLQQGSLLPGVRGIAYQGLAPQILPGRDGSQFLPYISQQIDEMYKVLMVEEINEEKNYQLDPYTLIQRSIQQQQKFSLYSENFETFLVDLATLYLELAKHYLPDDALIPAIGMREYINIEEFRKTTPLCYQIRVEPQSDTVETKLGKQLALNHALQYVGTQLTKEEIGKVMRAMPFGNFDEAFGDFTIDYDNVQNDLLALDRGQMPEIHDTDDNDYVLKRLVHRMKQADFRFLSPEVQQNYQAYKQQHEAALAEKSAKIMAAKQEFIPTGGAMIACDMYVPNEKDPEKAPRRVRVPYQAIDWLVQTLEKQGQSLSKLEDMNKGVLSEVADMVLARQSQGASPSMPPMPGMAVPGGV